MEVDTPGPWRVEEEDGNFGIFAGDRLLAVVTPDDTPERSERKANAILISAAPLLLSACRQIEELLETTAWRPQTGSSSTTRTPRHPRRRADARRGIPLRSTAILMPGPGLGYTSPANHL